MKKHSTLVSIASTLRRALGPITGLAVLLFPALAAAEDESGWSLNFTPVVLLPKDDYRVGGGTDPELKYTYDLGAARLSAGGRVGGYYAKNLFGVTVMPTVRVTLPLGAVEPYLAAGAGYGWLPELDDDGLATMARFGTVFHFSASFSIGVEATLQELHGSDFGFPSFGSMMAFDL
jgi:Lipid A 3-O-deacylase (PagL)